MRIDRRTLLATALAASCFPKTRPAAADDSPWMIMAGQDSGPSGRWGHNLAFDGFNNRLLISGGRDSSGAVEDDFWSFDIGSYTWSKLDIDGPAPRSGSATATAADGSGFYLFGGASNDSIFDDIWWFDFSATAWQSLQPAAGPTPAPRTGTSGVIDDAGRFVISHGRDDRQLYDDTWAFDPGTSSWIDLSPAPDERPMARSDHALLALPGYGLILLTGGCSDGTGPCPQGDAWVFDPIAGSWTDITPDVGPTPRTGSVLGQLGGVLLTVGGLTDLGPESDVWRGYFDGSTVGWTELTLVNHGPLGIYRRFFHAMTAAGSEFYVFGGNGVEGALSDLWRFSLDRFTESDHSLEPSGDYSSDDEYIEE